VPSSTVLHGSTGALAKPTLISCLNRADRVRTFKLEHAHQAPRGKCPLLVHAVFVCVSLAEQVLLADADLNDPRFVHARDADVLEYAVIKLALPSLLNDNLVPSIEQRPKG
jgi:hypothetical protein